MATNRTRPLSQTQRVAMGDLLRRVFVMLRAPGYGYFWTPEMSAEDKLAGIRYAFERSIAIGEAFHNIPLHMEDVDFWFDYHGANIQHYTSRFPELASFVERLDEINRMASNDPAFGASL